MTARAIEPGSTEYGQRQVLEEGLAQVGGGVGAGGPPAPAAGPPPLTIPEDPIGALLSGEVSGNPNLPITDGLSVGDGAGPMTNDPMLGNRASRLRMIAEEASSPMVRAAARNELRRMAREPV